MARAARRRRATRIGLALAGGGPAGAVYEIGALRALEQALDGVDFTEASVYVGVSAGSLLASALANGVTTSQMVRALAGVGPDAFPFDPATLFTPAYGEWIRRGVMLPALLIQSLWRSAVQAEDRSTFAALSRLGRALPIAVFDNEPIRRHLEAAYAGGEGAVAAPPGPRTDDFRQLKRTLRIIASDLDSGEAIAFGEPEWDHVPISRAVQASTAMPGLYPPVMVDGRRCVDGILLRTVHASVALELGAELLLCVNPVVPLDATAAARSGAVREDELVARGLPGVLSQSFRMLVHSRMHVGLATYRARFPHADVLLIEPERDEHELIFSNLLRFSSRRRICEHAYRVTRRDLLRRRAMLEPLLGRHGVRLDLRVLEDDTLDVWASAGIPGQAHTPLRREASRPDAPSGTARIITDLKRTLARLEDLEGGEGSAIAAR